MLSPRRRSQARVTGLALACAVAAGCGTTVSTGPPGVNGAAGPTGGSAMTAPISRGAGVTTAGGGAYTPAGLTTRPPLATTGGISTGAAEPDGAAPNGTPRATTHAAPYKVGVPYSTTDQAALAAIGAKGSVGDIKAEAQAVINWVNERGGVGGRPIVPKWFDENAALQPDEIAQQACVQWTQDDHVDAALPGGPNVDMDVLRQCLAKAAIPAVSIQWHAQSLQKDLATSPLWVEPIAISLESFAKTYVDTLASQQFFRGGRVGILYDDSPKWVAVEHAVLEPELQRVDADVVARASYHIESFGDVGPAEPSLRSYVLRFRGANVNRVISFEPWEGWGFFMMEADRQHFYPTWGLSSQTDWAVAYATGLVPESEMVGARYAGWSPVMDLKNMYDPATKPRWSRLQQCDDIYGRAGIKRDGALAEVFALAMCDGLLDLAALGRAAGGTLNRTTFNAAVDAMSWQSAFFPSTQVTTRRPDGVVAVRPARWDTARHCFIYTGPAAPAAP